MSDRINALLNRVEDDDLRNALAAEVAELTAEGKVGLVFEQHLPETMSLPHVRPRRGLKARLRSEPEGRLLEVVRVRGTTATCIPQRLPGENGFVAKAVQHPVSDLVTVAEFGDPIYPGLRELSRVEGPDADPDAPAHVVINAENHHALQALQYTPARRPPPSTTSRTTARSAPGTCGTTWRATTCVSEGAPSFRAGVNRGYVASAPSC